MSYRQLAHHRGAPYLFIERPGLGQVKPKTTTGVATTGGAAPVDNTARDVGTAVNIGGSLIGSLIGAATHSGAATPTTTEPDPAPYEPVVEAPGGGFFWPMAIGVGVLAIGGIAWMGMQTRLPKMESNRRRKKQRRNSKIGVADRVFVGKKPGWAYEVRADEVHVHLDGEPARWFPLNRVRKATFEERYAEEARLGGKSAYARSARTTKNGRTNYEGLTWPEWAYAAGTTPAKGTAAERKAWRNGEDPTDWRAMRRNPWRVAGAPIGGSYGSYHDARDAWDRAGRPRRPHDRVSADEYDDRGPTHRSITLAANRLTPRQRKALPKSAFVFPARRAWPLDTPERAYAAIQLLKLGRAGSASDFAKIRNAIMRRYPDLWKMYGRNLSWEKSKAAHQKGLAHRARRRSRKAA